MHVHMTPPEYADPATKAKIEISEDTRPLHSVSCMGLGECVSMFGVRLWHTFFNLSYLQFSIVSGLDK